MARRWSKTEVAELGRDYGVVGTAVLAERYGIPVPNLMRQASRLGLSKPWPEAREPYIEGDDCVIPLHSRKHHDKVAYVDADQYELVKKHRWHVVLSDDGRTYYARTNVDCVPVSLHTMLMRPPKGQMVDHKDGDGLNNRSSNIRVANSRLNAANAHHADKKKGVHQRGRRWIARIRSRYIGSFATEKEALLAYDDAARAIWGDFACPNFPDRQAVPDVTPSEAANRT